MIIGAHLLLAMGAALLATLLYALVTSTWVARVLVGMWLFGVVLVFAAISGPIRIGS